MNKIFPKIKNILHGRDCQSGVSLIISFFVMVIIVAIVLAITTLLYNEIKMVRNIGNSVVAFYAADSGIEKVLYYDRKIIPTGTTRGLCSMVNAVLNTTACPTRSDNSEIDSGLNCNQVSGVDFAVAGSAGGCDTNACDDCTISFSTSLDSLKGYEVTAKVASSTLTIDSLGTYNKLTRKVELYQIQAESEDVLKIVDAYADPFSSEVGTSIKVVVEAQSDSPNVISNVKAYIKTSYDQEWGDVPSNMILEGDDFTLDGAYDDGIWTAIWSGPEGSYYVDIIVTDSAGNTVTMNIQPYSF